jgi:hypothetical protein
MENQENDNAVIEEEVKYILLLEVDIILNEKNHNVFILSNDKVTALDQLKLWQAGNLSLIYYKGIDNLKNPTNKLSMGKGLGPMSIYRLIRCYSIKEFIEEEIPVKTI